MSDSHDGKIPGRPVNAILAVLDKPEDEPRLVSALVEHGISQERIHVLRGPEAARMVDDVLEANGLSGRIARAMAVQDSPNEDVERYELALRAGGCVVGVNCASPDEKDRAHQVLKSHGARFINFYGRWTIRPLEP